MYTVGVCVVGVHVYVCTYVCVSASVCVYDMSTNSWTIIYVSFKEYLRALT